jgi:hypothetical protein
VHNDHVVSIRNSPATRVPEAMLQRAEEVFPAKVKRKSNRPWRPIRLSDVKDPTLSRQLAGRLSALHTGRALLPRNIIIFLFLVLISVRG